MTTTDDSDTTLVLAARGGDRQALAALLARHWSLLRALCRRALDDPMLAEDAAQEAALEAMMSLDRLRQPERFGPWLGSIGLNVCRRWRRYRSRDAWSWEALIGGRYHARAWEPVDDGASPEALAEAAEVRARVRRAVAGLPRGQRAAVLLFYLEGLTHAETAALLGVEVGAVKARLHKARRALRQRLTTLWEEETMETRVETPLVEVRVADVRRRPAEGGNGPWKSVVLLEEVGGTRILPIWIGAFEAEALVMQLTDFQTPRPLTYTFAANVLQALGGRLSEVRIIKLIDTVFYAVAIVDGSRGTQTVDARPSDALNLALITGAPIRVAPTVFEQAGNAGDHGPLTADYYGEGAEGAAEIAAAIRGTIPGAGGPPPTPAPPPDAPGTRP